MRSVRYCLIATLWLLSAVVAVAADAPPSENTAGTGPAPGHSMHGEAFNEGPRQAAWIMEGLGRVQFPVSTKNVEAQQFFNQGLGQLHGFWYFEAERSFRQALALDRELAMAYWGLALANTNNQKRAKSFIEEAVKLKSKCSEREQLYIDALDAFHKADEKKKKERAEAYVKALEKITYHAPDDIEAKALLALQIWNNRDAGIPVHSHVAVNALLEEVFRREPLHPALHYRIHLWDSERPENAVAAAAQCGQSAPGIAHMWHMGGHIFSDVKRYSAAAWQQEASARVDHAYMQRARILPDQIHNYAHNNEWLVRDLCHVGRAHDAVSLARNMIELPRHPKHNKPSEQKSAHYGRLRLLETYRKFEMWSELIDACQGEYLPPGDDEADRLKRARRLGEAYARLGGWQYAESMAYELQQELEAKQAAQSKARKEAEEKARAEKKNDKEIEKAASDAAKPTRDRIEQLEKALKEFAGHRLVARGQIAEGLKSLRDAGDADAPYLNLLQFRSGERDAAEKAAREHAKGHEHQVPALASLVEILWYANKRDEAKAEFEKLRTLAGEADLNVRPLARLLPLAREFGWPDDWRTPAAPAADIGQRPALDTLGPFRWSPWTAPAWSLPNIEGQPRALADYRGRPLVLIFFLGHGCLHCAEQLQAFAPLAAEFRQAGLELAAISSDDVEGLKKSVEAYQPGVMPITLFSDAQLAVFKAYGAFDDFEQKPLHATLVIDAAGRVRWQDIGFEPFSDARFVLQESQRLLSFP